MEGLTPITKELLDGLTGPERHQALKNYREWQVKVRAQDRKAADKAYKKRYYFIFKEEIKKKQKDYYNKKVGKP